MKSAVTSFIEEIQKNDIYEEDGVTPRKDEHGNLTPLGNQISIVKFAEPTYYSSSTSWVNGNATTPSITPGNHFPEYRSNNGNYQYRNFSTNYYESSQYSRYNATEVIIGFTSTATEANVTALTSSVDGLIAAGSTAADYGMNLAKMLINSLGEDRSESKKIVVFFTDGEPNHSSGFTNSVATDAIKYSGDIKAITYGEGEDATHPIVYSVGLFSSSPESGSNLENFMNYISSNYPNASAYNNGGTRASRDYYMDASGGSAEDLNDIFTAIAHSNGGSQNTQVSGGSALTVDIVSSSFSVPIGFEENPENAVTVMVAPCTGVATIGGQQYLSFGTAKSPSEYGLPAITTTISEEDNKVSTTGFDYSANWCGPDPTNTTSQIQPGYHGFKQIISFTITVKDDAVGGPNVETNDPNSGIYLPGSTEPLIKFNRPTVKLPVQIWIQKAGLNFGDSAVFTLARSPYVKDFDPKTAEWESITKIVVGPDDYDRETGLYLKKQVGMDPDYYYRIKEDAWAFGYTYQDGGILYTFGDNAHNPFEFNNTPKNKKFDEASVRNVFKEKKPADNSSNSEGK